MKANRMYPRQSSMPDRRSTDKSSSFSPYDTSTWGNVITPACLKALYGIPDATINQPENALGVFGLGGFYDQVDLNLYWSQFAPWVPNGTHPKLQSINGATNGLMPTMNAESTVDFDISVALLYPQEVTLYRTQATQSKWKSGPRSTALGPTIQSPPYGPTQSAWHSSLSHQRRMEISVRSGRKSRVRIAAL
jgi:hypothetical protein